MQQQLEKLTAQVELLPAKSPAEYKEQPAATLLATICPFAGSRMLRDLLHQQGVDAGRPHHRLRPKLMTVFAVLASLAPILWDSGIGSDVLKPIAAPHRRRHDHLGHSCSHPGSGILRDAQAA